MNERIESRLVYLAGALILVSATIHLVLGIAGVFNPSVIGVETIVLPVGFIIAAILAFALVGAFRTGALPTGMAYSLGAALMVVYILAYIDFHVLQVGERVVPLGAVGLEASHAHGPEPGTSHHDHGSHTHDDSVFTVLVDHLREDGIAAVTKTAEFIAAGILAPLAVCQKLKE